MDQWNKQLIERFMRDAKEAIRLGDFGMARTHIISDKGGASCVDARTGRPHWRERIGGNYSASLLFADERIHAFSEDGKTVVWKPGTRFRRLTENKLDGRLMASPAVEDRSLYLRTDTHLYRIENQ